MLHESVHEFVTNMPLTCPNNLLQGNSMVKTYTETMNELRETGHALNTAIVEAEAKGWAVLLYETKKGLLMRIVQGNLRTTDILLRDA